VNAAVAVLAAVAGAGAWALLSDGEDGTPVSQAAPVRTGAATVERRRLVDREDVEGTLGYAGRRTVAASGAGTLTSARAEGELVRRGGSLFAVDGRRTAYVLYGKTPAYRALSSGVADGADVRQLERNLERLGYDPGTVDREFTAATAAAVKAWEDDRGVTEDGVVERGEVVFTQGPVRVGERKPAVGEAVGAGRPVLEVTSRRRVVTARLPAGRQALARRGDRVDVTMPGGAVVRGTIAEVGRVARPGEEGAEATVSLEVALRGEAARRVRLDGAPVTVSVARTEPATALAVPVSALLATGTGRYAVEVLDGDAPRLVPVRTGVYADGWVEVGGRGLREGVRVVVPR
jgi:peptidoglycan hydrolase-like protein with peptidoglycan-binding domain